MNTVTENFLHEIPKSDLHLHLDGSLRINTLIELAKENNIDLPSFTESGLKEIVFKNGYNNLVEYLEGFKYTTAVMQNKESIERIAYELAMDCIAENTCYIEVRYAPQLHSHEKFSISEILEATNKGLSRAKKEFNNSEKVKSEEKVPFEYGIIGCAMRMIGRNFSDYYNNLYRLHPLMSDKEKAQIAAFDLARELVKARDELGIPVVGFDIAGAERGYPAENYSDVFNFVHRNFLKKTVHAGEAFGPTSIFQAIADCHADRIGHGTHLFNEQMVDVEHVNTKQYVKNLVEYIADRRITIEVCLTSNAQTMPELSDLKKHPVKKMLEHKLSVTFCTDNRLVSNTTSTKELQLAVKNYNLTLNQLRDITAYGFKRSFYYGTYLEKRKYIRKVIDTFEKFSNSL